MEITVLSNTIRPIRVLYVIPGISEGPTFIFAKRQVNALIKQGITGENFYLGSRTAPHAILFDYLKFKRVIRSFKPDIIHAQYGTVTALFAALSTSLPLVITFRGSDLNPVPSIGTLRNYLGNLFSQIASLRAKRIICVSEQLSSRLWRSKNIIDIIPTGIDTDVFFPFPHRDSLRKKLGWKDTDKIILFNGRDPVGKRLDLAQAACSIASTTITDLRLEVLSGKVDADIIPEYMNAADCLLVTSDWEGSPNIVKEALATGLPVVSVNVGDVKDRLVGVYPSLIVEKDPVSIASGLIEILKINRRSNGPQFVEQFTQNHVIKQILSIYQQIFANDPSKL